jgi:protein transport protein SEC24
LQGPRSRIDPNQIPSPVDVLRLDQDKYDQEPFMTCNRSAIPQSMTEFVAIDQGNCSPRFIRLTTYALPHSDDLAVAAQLPLGMIVQPFAELKPEESPVPVVDFGEVGPPRCDHCRGYINPWCQFVNGGQRFLCNLCGGTSEVPAEYFAHLDVSGRRVDLDQRAELCRGSVDFVVPKAYWAQTPALSPMAAVTSAAAGHAAPSAAGAAITASSEADGRPPEPMRHVFAIDVSWQSAQSGVIQEVAKSIKAILYGEDEGGDLKVDGEEGVQSAGKLARGSKVAIITFDRTVHFYNMRVRCPACHLVYALIPGIGGPRAGADARRPRH